MRIARAHHRAAILENLDVSNPGNARERFEFTGPHIDNLAHSPESHPRDAEVMARRETNHAANPGLRAGHEQSRLVYFASVGLRKKRRVVVVKNESTRVIGIFGAAGSRVAGTQITSGIVSGPIGRCRLIDLAEPWSLAAMRRDQHPFARQRIPAAMRI